MSLQSPKLIVSVPLTTESPLRDLSAILRSHTPLIAVETNEEPQIVSLVRQIAQRLQIRAYRWTVTEGLQAFDACDQPTSSVVKSQEMLSYIKNSGSHCLFVLLDFHRYLQDEVHVRFLKDIALASSKNYSTVLLVATTLPIPEELRPFTAYFHLPLPTPDELRGIVYDVAGEWGAEHGRRTVQTTNKAIDLLVRNLAGLTATDARRLARKAINDNGAITESDIPEVMRAKYELLGRDSPLSFEYETAQFAEIGGMRRLRQWLDVRKSFFREEPTANLDPPKGMLLLGVHYSKYYGETEKNLRNALDTAEVMAPCVLWLDEIEKGLAVGDDDDGLSRRVLGTLLTWMAERRKPVFIVATANDIERLPPEMVRKGRFDEIFFVDLPAAATRSEIFKIHLQKRYLEPSDYDLNALAAAAEGF